jgi:hypothetical protein
VPQPVPCTATKFPGIAPLCRNALNVVTPHKVAAQPRPDQATQAYSPPPLPEPHILRITTVVGEPRDFPRHTIAKIAATTRNAGSILPAMPSHTNALPLLPSRDSRAHFIDRPGNFVPRRPRRRPPRPKPVFHIVIALKQIPHACTRIRTCPAPGCGISRS